VQARQYHEPVRTPPIDRPLLSPYAAIKTKGRNTMPLIILIVALAVLKYLEVGPLVNLSWWWIVGLFLVAFIWFEFIERMLGLDKRKAHEQLDKARRERVEKNFRK
jgi:small Trp-rich protein